ncbi:MAG: hypothetical protein H0V05_09970 [Euzebyaceae bacterium]|nr:hypothetical protein [Euzebyaceae bacterium]
MQDALLDELVGGGAGLEAGLSCTQGSGHSSPSSIACWTVAAMRLSAMSTKLRVKPA